MKTAKLFQNGRSQAVRLPREFRFKGQEVYIKRTSQGVLLTEVDPWMTFEEGLEEIAEDFMTERRQAEVQVRDFGE